MAVPALLDSSRCALRVGEPNATAPCAPSPTQEQQDTCATGRLHLAQSDADKKVRLSAVVQATLFSLLCCSELFPLLVFQSPCLLLFHHLVRSDDVCLHPRPSLLYHTFAPSPPTFPPPCAGTMLLLCNGISPLLTLFPQLESPASNAILPPSPSLSVCAAQFSHAMPRASHHITSRHPPSSTSTITYSGPRAENVLFPRHPEIVLAPSLAHSHRCSNSTATTLHTSLVQPSTAGHFRKTMSSSKFKRASNPSSRYLSHASQRSWRFHTLRSPLLGSGQCEVS